MSAPTKERPVARGSIDSCRSTRRSSALREYVEYVRRHAPEGVEKLERFIASLDIVGIARKKLPIPFGDHQVTFRCADGMLVCTSQPYHGWPSAVQFDAYTRFAFDYRLSGGISPGEGWWAENTCLVVFLNDGSPGRDLYFLGYEIPALYPRMLECLNLLDQDLPEARRRIKAICKDAKRLGQRVDQAFAEMEAAFDRA